MKRVLIVAYYFPPSGGPGVQRVLKFVKFLPEFGWEPHVLTVSNGDFPARDESLLKEIPPGVRVHRSRIFEPYRMYRTLTGKPADAPVDVENIPREGKKQSWAERTAQWVRSTLFIPDARIGWYWPAVLKGLTVIRAERIDALYSSSPPYTASLIARALHRRTGKPWIAGFRDPWTGFLSAPQRWSLPAAIDASMERAVAEDCDILEGAWEGILDDFAGKIPSLPKSKMIYLPNGFDPDDFPPHVPKRNERFTVVYTGSMYGKRNPSAFLAAVEQAVGEGLFAVSQLRLRFIGRFGADVRAMFDATPLREAIEVVSYLPHSESVAQLLSADTLLLVVDETEGSPRIVPGKVFEYIGSGRPILALAPTGAVNDILKETGTGISVPHGDIPGIKKAFIECYRIFQYGEADFFAPHPEAIKKYDRREITQRLALHLNSIVHH